MDPEGRAATRAIVAGLRDAGVAILLTSHDLTDVERMADRVCILDRGRIVAAGTPGELAAGAKPRLRFRLEGSLDPAERVEPRGRPGARARPAPALEAETDAGYYRIERRRAGRRAVAALAAWCADGRPAHPRAADDGRNARGRLPRADRPARPTGDAAEPAAEARREPAGLADRRDPCPDRDRAPAHRAPRRERPGHDHHPGGRAALLRLVGRPADRCRPARRLPASGIARACGHRHEPGQSRDRDGLRASLRRAQAARRLAADPWRPARGEDAGRPRRRGRPGRAARRDRGRRPRLDAPGRRRAGAAA